MTRRAVVLAGGSRPGSGGHCDFPDLVLALPSRGAPVGCCAYDGCWLDIGREDGVPGEPLPQEFAR